MSSTNEVQIRAPRKARAMINNMLTNKSMTSEGLNWLTLATDPFHDAEIPPSGFPDADPARSIVQCYSFTSQIVAPPSLGTPTWDSHIFFAPVTPNRSFSLPGDVLIRALIAPSGVVTLSSNNVLIRSGYNAISIPSGVDWTNTTIGPYGDSPTIAYPLSGASGQFRLVGCGCEIVNTTPELYRGGSVTVYRTPTSNTVRTITPSTNIRIPQNVSVLPPSTQAEAQLYPSSRTWGAEDGAYVIGTLNGTTNPYTSAQPGTAALTQQMNASNFSTGSTVVTYVPPPVFTNVPVDSCNTILPYDNHGAIFTGLQPQATLQVTVRYYIERIPTSSNPELLVLTRPPTPYDPMALEIYARVMGMLPPGVPVAENPLGEWFNDIMSAVSDFAPTVGALVNNFVPGAKAIGDTMGTAARALVDKPKPVQNKGPGKQKKKKPSAGGPTSPKRVTNQKRKK